MINYYIEIKHFPHDWEVGFDEYKYCIVKQEIKDEIVNSYYCADNDYGGLGEFSFFDCYWFEKLEDAKNILDIIKRFEILKT